MSEWWFLREEITWLSQKKLLSLVSIHQFTNVKIYIKGKKAEEPVFFFLFWFDSSNNRSGGGDRDGARGHAASRDNNMALWLPPSPSSFSFSYAHLHPSTRLTFLPFRALSVLSDGYLNTIRGWPLQPLVYANLGHDKLCVVLHKIII